MSPPNPPSLAESSPYTSPLVSDTDRNASFFRGLIVILEDESDWQITKPLSYVKYDYGSAPCEATQVFTCVCIADPQSLYTDAPEAVVKVKYQIKMSFEALRWEESWLRRIYDNVQKCQCKSHGSKPQPPCTKCKRQIDENEKIMYTYTNPVTSPNDATRKEWEALRHFRQVKFPYSPWLHGVHVWINVSGEGMDERAMVGGYCWCMVMTKVPGKRLSISDLKKMSLEERDEVRKALKEALIGLYKIGIYHDDAALRNLMWDKEQRKCYIVDFEKYDFFDPEQHGVQPWRDDEYDSWNLSEEWLSKFRD